MTSKALQASEAKEGPKATSPPQELEVGGLRPPYLLVADIVTLVNTLA